MMVNRSTIDYHLANLTRSLDSLDGQIETLNPYFEPNPNTNQNPNHRPDFKCHVTKAVFCL